MKSFTLNFWPGLLLAILLLVGPGLALLGYALTKQDNFQYGLLGGIGLASAINGAVKLYKELRGL